MKYQAVTDLIHKSSCQNAFPFGTPSSFGDWDILPIYSKQSAPILLLGQCHFGLFLLLVNIV